MRTLAQSEATLALVDLREKLHFRLRLNHPLSKQGQE
jgi:hypothetical protein